MISDGDNNDVWRAPSNDNEEGNYDPSEDEWDVDGQR